MNESAKENQSKSAILVRRHFLEKPPNVQKENEHNYVFINILAFFGLSSHASWIPIFWLLGVKQLAFFNFISVSLWLVAIILNRKGFHLTSVAVVVFEVCLHQILCVVIIGWSAGFQYYIFCCPFAIYLMPHGRNFIKLVLMLICFSSFSLIDLFFRVADPIILLNLNVLSIFNYSNIIVVFAVFGFGCYFFNVKVYKADAALRTEQLKVEKAYSLLSKYVAPQLSETISDGKIDQIWEHNRKKLTLFFSDIKDFTSITDTLEPEDMANVLNEYLTEMNTIINEYKGTLAQVIGDGLYTFFGAPESSSDRDNALRCVNMAIDMQRKMKELNKRWFNKGIDEVLQIRCGINTGMATVGGYGSSERKEYTAMGMQTNIAARLEQTCTPGGILISHTTWALVNGEISCSEKEHINVKGLDKPIRVYSVDTVAGETNIQ